MGVETKGNCLNEAWYSKVKNHWSKWVLLDLFRFRSQMPSIAAFPFTLLLVSASMWQ